MRGWIGAEFAALPLLAGCYDGENVRRSLPPPVREPEIVYAERDMPFCVAVVLRPPDGCADAALSDLPAGQPNDRPPQLLPRMAPWPHSRHHDARMAKCGRWSLGQAPPH